MQSELSIDTLVKMLETTDNWQRTTTIERLIQYDSAVVEPVLPLLHHEDGSIRRTVIWLLAAIGDVQAIEPLLQVVMRDQDYEVCKAAIIAVGELGDPRSIEPLLGAARIRGRSFWYDIRDALFEIGLVEPLLTLLPTQSNLGRYLIIDVLGEFADDAAIQPLIVLLHDPHPKIRRVAIRALGWHANFEAISPLLSLLKDEDETIQKCAASALIRIGDTQSIQVVKKWHLSRRSR